MYLGILHYDRLREIPLGKGNSLVTNGQFYYGRFPIIYPQIIKARERKMETRGNATGLASSHSKSRSDQ
jgi:hypothetical protein